MPADTNVQVLRRHGLHVLADWAENIANAPAYARQSQYRASVLTAPVIPDFAEWEMRDAREFEFEAELPFGDAPAVFPYYRRYLWTCAAVGSVIQPRFRTRTWPPKRSHMRKCGRTIKPPRPGVIQGSILC